ncbi:IKZF [Mytilus edulis]|uniref:IKZF n=1 Tax=Mytilus edulis TaxID=6550 RepID=A0A8S3TC10_MYTED|nr:IKZF [Mytilus edulis]
MTLVDTYLKANVSSADQFTYKIFQQNALQYMINTEMKNHMLYKQDCKGDLKFDTEAQVKWGLAWQERFQCNICGFKSAFHKLYEEVESLKRGRRAATVKHWCTRSRKQNEKSRFALDIKARCVAELNTGFSVHKGNLQLMKAHMPNVIDAIIMCYKGNCGSSCKLGAATTPGSLVAKQLKQRHQIEIRNAPTLTSHIFKTKKGK